MLHVGQCLSLAKRTLSECDFEDLAALNDSMRQMAAELNISFTHLMLLLRLAIAGSKVKYLASCMLY